MKCILMTIFLKWFKQFKISGKTLKVPKTIKDDTEWFLNAADHDNKYKDWFDTNVTKGEQEVYNVKKSDLLTYFNADNNTNYNSVWFNRKLSYFGYAINNTSGYGLAQGKNNTFYRKNEKEKCTVVTSIFLPNVVLSQY
jgi:hypothetical protein